MGSGLALGIFADSLLRIGVGALIVGVVLNVLLLLRAVFASGNLDRAGMAILGGVFAGVYDAAKVFGLAFLTRLLVGLFQ